MTGAGQFRLTPHTAERSHGEWVVINDYGLYFAGFRPDAAGSPMWHRTLPQAQVYARLIDAIDARDVIRAQGFGAAAYAVRYQQVEANQ